MRRRKDNVRCTHDWLLHAGEEPALAAHLVTPRTLYNHHGIYVGNGRVIHYAGLAHGWRRGPVEEVSLERFAHGRHIRVRNDSARFDRSEVVARARSRLGERSYRVLTNNCEHLCVWALRGESRSLQVERLFDRLVLQCLESLAGFVRTTNLLWGARRAPTDRSGGSLA